MFPHRSAVASPHRSAVALLDICPLNARVVEAEAHGIAHCKALLSLGHASTTRHSSLNNTLGSLFRCSTADVRYCCALGPQPNNHLSYALLVLFSALPWCRSALDTGAASLYLLNKRLPCVAELLQSKVPPPVHSSALWEMCRLDTAAQALPYSPTASSAIHL